MRLRQRLVQMVQMVRRDRREAMVLAVIIGIPDEVPDHGVGSDGARFRSISGDPTIRSARAGRRAGRRNQYASAWGTVQAVSRMTRASHTQIAKSSSTASLLRSPVSTRSGSWSFQDFLILDKEAGQEEMPESACR